MRASYRQAQGLFCGGLIGYNVGVQPTVAHVLTEFINHPSAWRASEFASLDSLAFELGPKHIASLEAGLRQVRERGLARDDITSVDFPLTEISDDLATIKRQVLHGPGIALIRGFPVERYDEDDISTMYWGLGSHFGRALSQSVVGDRLGRVTNHGDLDRNERAYRNRRQLMPHTDRSHIIGMLSIRPAKKGGISGYVNGLAAHNVVAAEHPELLPVLYRGFEQHRFGEEPSDEAAVSPAKPIFSVQDGVPSMQYIRGYYDMAMEERGLEYSDEERAALDFLDEVILRPDMKLNLLHQPGDLTFINNYVVMHSRTEFEDYDEPERKRLLLRLWLYDPTCRPLIESYQLDEYHAGVPPQVNRDSAYFTRWDRTEVE